MLGVRELDYEVTQAGTYMSRIYKGMLEENVSSVRGTIKFKYKYKRAREKSHIEIKYVITGLKISMYPMGILREHKLEGIPILGISRTLKAEFVKNTVKSFMNMLYLNLAKNGDVKFNFIGGN